jgi:hypothetical protein
MHKGVKCLDIYTGRIYISRDVVFDENVFPFASLHPNAGALLKQEILLLPSNASFSSEGVQNVDNHVSPIVPLSDIHQVEEAPASSRDQTDTQISSKIDFANQPENDKTDTESEDDSLEHSLDSRDPEASQHEEDSPARSALTPPCCPEEARGGHTPLATGQAPPGMIVDNASLSITPPRPSPSLSPGARSEADSSLGSSVAADDGGRNTSDDISSPLSASNDEPPFAPTDEPIAVRTRLQKGIRNPKQYTDGMLSSTGEPYTLTEAFGDPNWRKAMEEEYNALIQIGILSLQIEIKI